jgi:phospholipid/cholesterol/gamma-HCH transport system substrate-binding protein
VKSTVELRLAPREDKYYLIQLVDDPRGRTSYSSTVYTNHGGPADQPVQWRQDREVTQDAFRFSVQFARRISWATFRFGLIESTGGVGLDLHLFDDNLEIQSDLFAFGEDVFPRERTSAAWEFLSHMWIHAGIDDAFNADRTDYFFGGQLRFDDEDLKAILTVAPTP